MNTFFYLLQKYMMQKKFSTSSNTSLFRNKNNTEESDDRIFDEVGNISKESPELSTSDINIDKKSKIFNIFQILIQQERNL